MGENIIKVLHEERDSQSLTTVTTPPSCMPGNGKQTGFYTRWQDVNLKSTSLSVDEIKNCGFHCI